MLQPKDIPTMEGALAERGITVPEFCKKSEIDETTWWRWRSGKLLPRMSNWLRVCEVYEGIVGKGQPQPVQVMQ